MAHAPARWLRTVRHLEASQLWHRIRLSVRRAYWEHRGEAIDARYRARAGALPPADLRHPGLARVAALRRRLVTAESSRSTADDVIAGRFRFLGVERTFGDPLPWFDPSLDEGTRLWKTLLHEFPYAIDLAWAARETSDDRYRERCIALMRSWAEQARIGMPGFARDSWNARAVATRLIHWSVAAAVLEIDPASDDGQFISESVGLHGLFLRENLEWDVRANHLLRDAVGLIFANELCGCAPEALDLLRTQLAEQLLADGCHYERTPHYHAIVLQDLLETRALLGDAAPSWLADSITRMAGFLAYLLPEDGRLPLFGDTWHAEPAPGRLLAEAGPAAPPTEPERASGLVALRAGPAHLVLRAGAHGPDHQLGHAHADLLSFEASLGGRRIVTDTGTGTYDPGPVRDRARSTAAHNTVQLDGCELLETWGSFRCGRRGSAEVRWRGSAAGFELLHIAHDGWRFLPGAPRHERLVALGKGRLLVLDAVLGAGRHRVRNALHLHPEAPAALRISWLPRGATPHSSPVPLHERFNETREMTELALEVEAPLPWAGGYVISWVGGPAEDWELVYEHDRVRAQTVGLEIEWEPGPTPQVTVHGFEATLPSAT
jgi:uncharacterized heparinase superfamily protein